MWHACMRAAVIRLAHESSHELAQPLSDEDYQMKIIRWLGKRLGHSPGVFRQAHAPAITLRRRDIIIVQLKLIRVRSPARICSVTKRVY
jgi:hypothetical protein